MNAENPSLNNCKICGHETRILKDPELKLNFYVCTNCNYTFKETSAIVSQKEEKSLYDHHINTMENEGYVNMFKRFLEAGVLPFKTTGKALDFGSGPGPVLYEILKQQGFDAHHYDPYYHDDLSVFKRQYDLITSTEVFEHLSDPHAVIKKLCDALNPGGVLAVMTSFKTEDDATFLKWWYRRDATHIGFFTEKAFALLIKDYPLKTVYSNNKNIITFEKE